MRSYREFITGGSRHKSTTNLAPHALKLLVQVTVQCLMLLKMIPQSIVCELNPSQQAHRPIAHSKPVDIQTLELGQILAHAGKPPMTDVQHRGGH